jgi:hypothetical protein
MVAHHGGWEQRCARNVTASPLSLAPPGLLPAGWVARAAVRPPPLAVRACGLLAGATVSVCDQGVAIPFSPLRWARTVRGSELLIVSCFAVRF